jgi:hypothetical protein
MRIERRAWHHHFQSRHPPVSVDRFCDIRPPDTRRDRPNAPEADQGDMLLVGLLATTWLTLATVALRAARRRSAVAQHGNVDHGADCRRAETSCGHSLENGALRRRRANVAAPQRTRVRRYAGHPAKGPSQPR